MCSAGVLVDLELKGETGFFPSISVCELCNCAPVFAFQSQFVVAVPKPDKVIVQATKQETFI